MNLVIDANVFKGYFECVLANPHQLTEDPSRIFTSLGQPYLAFVDSSQIIVKEWEALVDPDWFRAWYPGVLAGGSVLFIDISNKPHLKKKLTQNGFPSSKDFIYVLTSASVVDNNGDCHLLTEDIDFFDPTQKQAGSKVRNKLLQNQSGQMRKLIKKETKVEVTAVCTCP
jgi:hypothetical protein